MADTLTTVDGSWCHVHSQWRLEDVPRVRSYNWDLTFDVAEHHCPVLRAKGESMKIVRWVALGLAAMMAATACSSDARVVSENISQAADQFEIQRRIVFLNGITDTYLLSIEGLCSIEDETIQLEVTCKHGPDAYVKHFLGLSDNVTYFAEQLVAADVSAYHYRVIFKPQVLLPDIDFRGDSGDLPRSQP